MQIEILNQAEILIQIAILVQIEIPIHIKIMIQSDSNPFLIRLKGNSPEILPPIFIILDDSPKS